jgi:chromosomal replication initiation ATPase DnaA
MVIYLMKRQTAAINRDVGEMFGGLTCSAVAKICQRFGKKMQADEELALEVGRLSRVKGWPLSRVFGRW